MYVFTKSKESKNTDASNTNGSSSGSSPKTYVIDIRYFLVMLLSCMIVFFIIGVLTAPSPPAAISTSNSSPSPSINTPTDNVLLAQRRTNAKHSSEIGYKIGDLNETHVNFEQPTYEDFGTGEGAIQRPHTNKNTESLTSSVEEHLPAGQHLLVDIKNVQAAFLNSEERLASAMVETVKSAGLTLLSYHCHSLIPSGVSCVGVLLESHISFHTWPDEGVITLDLFTCGENPLLPVVPVLERLFGIPRHEDIDDEEAEEVVTAWSHELRGFRQGEGYGGASKTNYLDSKSDLATWVISPLDLDVKQQVIVTTSEFHRIDIWDIVGKEDKPSYEDSLKHNLTEGDPRWITTEITSPNRILFIDGALSIQQENEREFSESLVHPAMFTHPNPVNVAVIGGAGSSTIREILKHQTVKSITMIEQDEALINIAREYLTFMSDCTDIFDVAGVCFDDERVNIITEDPITWFLDRFGQSPTEESSATTKEKFDVIIFQTLAPQHKKDMFNNEEFIEAVMNSLAEDGTFASFLGEAHTIHDPRAEFGAFAIREKFMQILEKNENAGAMFVYEESHTGLDKNAAFLTVCKNAKCRDSWYADAMVIDYAISTRMRGTKSKKPILLHFDGGTQHSFQIPPRAWEEVYCRRDPVPFECDFRGLDLSKEIFEIDLDNEDENSFEIVKGQDEKGKETYAIYATEDIPSGSYIMPSDLAASFTIAEYTHNSLKSNAEIKDTGDVSVIKNFLDFIEDHGHETISDGSTLRYVEVGASFMIRKSSNSDEVNIARWMPQHPSGKQPVYSPVYDRHMISFDVFLIASKDIKKGAELVKPENLWSM